MAEKLILVTGSTGYIASHLIPRLLDLGYRVRCLARTPHRLHARAWSRYVDVVTGDVTIPSTLPAALEGVHTAYYLIHNMAAGRGYPARETDGAQNFLQAAEQAGVQHIIYLGGLADENTPSRHMRSRLQTGEILRQGHIPVTEFRASVIVGPGSISFEMIRYMTELMPIIFGPPWLQNLAQPIAIQNVIDYLTAVLETPKLGGQVYEIGGPDILSYAEAMLAYGHLRGLRRKYVVVPGIPLWLMALGVEWVTPVPAIIARPLVGGMRGASVVRQPHAQRVFPHIRLISYEDAVREALTHLHPHRITPGWEQNLRPSSILKQEGFFLDHRSLPVAAPPEQVFAALCSMGGRNGWPYANRLWQLRGWLDRLLTRPERSMNEVEVPQQLKTGDTLDSYRVEALEANRRLLLRAELKAPGDGWMEWKVQPHEGGSLLTQTAFFAPHGLPGFLYWYGLWPLHTLVFRGLLRALARQSEKKQAASI
ncbi:MAG: SDR family oxidoreductase [Anaerolineales bacterium]